MLSGQRLLYTEIWSAPSLLDHMHGGNEPALHKGFTISAYYDLCTSSWNVWRIGAAQWRTREALPSIVTMSQGKNQGL